MWYAQGSYMGLVANGGADQTQTFTGWKLKDSGSGNMTNVLSGSSITLRKRPGATTPFGMGSTKGFWYKKLGAI